MSTNQDLATNLNSNSLADNWSYAKHESSSFSYVWTLCDYRTQQQQKKVGEEIRSPIFCTELRVLCSSSNGKEVSAKFSLSILSENGSKCILRDTEHKFSLRDVNCDWGYKEFLEKKTLDSDGSKYLNANQLIIKCALTIPAVNDTKSDHKSVTNDLGKLLKNEEFADVSVIVGERTFNVHKTILVARSSVFKAMFEHETVEKEQGQINITDISEEVVYGMLQYMYTGEVSNLKTKAGDLIAAADKYDLVPLRSMCEEVLCSRLSVANAAEMLVLADRYNASKLKAETLALFSKRTNEIMVLDNWRNMIRSYPDLLLEAYEVLRKLHSESVSCTSRKQ